MPDREKVISTLEEIKSQTAGIGLDSAVIAHGFIDKVIALLKEQEAVKPVPPEDEFGLYRCGKCYHQLFRCVDKYCSRCGQEVKWE